MNATDRNLIRQDLPPTNEAPRPKARHSWWPYLLIGLGVLTLLDRFGVPTWGMWNVTGMWWPLVMIVIGVGLLTRSYTWGRPLTVGLVIAAMLVAVFWNRSQPAFFTGQTSETISQAITATRAEIQLGTTVGAMETIRLNLLRLHAGSLTLEALTTHIGRANAVSADVDRLIAAREEVEDVLRCPRRIELTPV